MRNHFKTFTVFIARHFRGYIAVVTAYLLACFPCYLNSPVYLPSLLFAHYFSSRFFSISYHIEFISFHNTAQIRRPCFLGYIQLFHCLYAPSFSHSPAPASLTGFPRDPFQNNGFCLLPPPRTLLQRQRYREIGLIRYLYL